MKIQTNYICNNNNYNALENMKISKRIVFVIIILIITQVRMLGDRIGGGKRPGQLIIIIIIDSKKMFNLFNAFGRNIKGLNQNYKII